MYPHTKFGIPTSKNIGDMDRTRKRDGHTDGRTDSGITICLPKFLWGHKKYRDKKFNFLKNYNPTPLDMYNGLSQIRCIKPEGRIHTYSEGYQVNQLLRKKCL